MSSHPQYWGVYRIFADGRHEYVSRTATTSEKLAMEIASDLSIGHITRPDGSILLVPAHPHVHKLIPDEAPKGWPEQSACPHCGYRHPPDGVCV